MKAYEQVRRYVHAIRNAVRKRGLVTNLRLAVHEVWFDIRHGTDTFKMIEVDEIADVPAAMKVASVHYQAVNTYFFRQILANLGPRFDQEVFVDYGSGKGRALMLAARMGFKRVIGVEFSQALCSICRENFRRFQARTGISTPMEVFHGDATAFVVPDDATVFYLFNPFGPQTLAPVVAEILRSLAVRPRAARIVYVNPRHQELLTSQGFRKIHTLRVSPDHEDAAIFALERPFDEI